MTDTIDRLVRMLDEEREGHRREREHAGQLAQKVHTAALKADDDLAKERRRRERAETDRTDALKKIDDWETFGRALQGWQSKLTAAQRKTAPAFPDHFCDIPF